MKKLLKKLENSKKLIKELFQSKKQRLKEVQTSLVLALTKQDEMGHCLKDFLIQTTSDILIQGVMIWISIIPFAVLFHNWNLANPLFIPSYGVLPWVILNLMRLVHERKYNK